MGGIIRALKNIDVAPHKVGNHAQYDSRAPSLKVGGQKGALGGINLSQVGGNRSPFLKVLNAGVEAISKKAYAGQVDLALSFARKPEAMEALYQRFERARSGGVGKAERALLNNFRGFVAAQPGGIDAIPMLEKARTKAYAEASAFDLTGNVEADIENGERVLRMIDAVDSELMTQLGEQFQDSSIAWRAKGKAGGFVNAPREIVLSKLAEAGIHLASSSFNRLRQLPDGTQALAKQKQAVLDGGQKVWDGLKPDDLVDLYLYASSPADYLSAADRWSVGSATSVEGGRIKAYFAFFESGQTLAAARLDRLRAQYDESLAKLAEVAPNFYKDNKRINELQGFNGRLENVEAEAIRLFGVGLSVSDVKERLAREATQIKDDPAYQQGRQLHGQAEYQAAVFGEAQYEFNRKRFANPLLE